MRPSVYWVDISSSSTVILFRTHQNDHDRHDEDHLHRHEKDDLHRHEEDGYNRHDEGDLYRADGPHRQEWAVDSASFLLLPARLVAHNTRHDERRCYLFQGS